MVTPPPEEHFPGEEPGARAAEPTDMVALRERLSIVQQMQELQTQLSLGNPSQTQSAMRAKPPEGSYSMSQGDFRNYL